MSRETRAKAAYDAFEEEEEMQNTSNRFIPSPHQLVQMDKRDPSLHMNMEGSFNRLTKKQLIDNLAKLEAAGWDIRTPSPQIVTAEINFRSVKQVCEVLVAYALQTRPEAFTKDAGVEDLFIPPVSLLTYFIVLVLNRIRAVANLSGDAIATIPYISDDAPIPRPLYNMLAAIAVYKDGREYGVLSFNYDNEFQLVDESISGPSYVETNINTPACALYQGNPGTYKGIHGFTVDPTTREVVMDDSVPITPISISDFWSNVVSEEKLFQIVGQIFPERYTYGSLGMTTDSADFFASARPEPNGGPGPANQQTCPFGNYDEFHASVYTYFARSITKIAENQKPTMQAPVLPSEDGISAQLPREYIVVNYVLSGILNDHSDPVYLGSKKYYSLGGRSYRPSVQFKKIDPQMIQRHALDLARAYVGVIGDAIKAQTQQLLSVDIAQNIYNSPRFYKELILAMTTKIFKTIQLQCFSFGKIPSQTALYNIANLVQLGGSLSVVQKNLAPIVKNGNLVLPHFDFGKTGAISPWYEMDFAQNAVVNNNTVKTLYHSQLDWNVDITPFDEFLVHFEDQVINSTWITNYTGLAGYRLVPGTSVQCSRVYEEMIEAYVSASPALLSQGIEPMGGPSMLTFTKALMDFTTKEKYPSYDTEASPAYIPHCSSYQFNLEMQFYNETLVGRSFSESLVSPVSVDIISDDPREYNDFLEVTPLSQMPGSLSAYALLNNDCANPNGKVQKAYSMNMSLEHAGQTLKMFGMEFDKKEDDNMCFFEAIGTLFGSIGSAVVSATVDPVINVVNDVVGIVDDAVGVAESIFSTKGRTFYQGSPFNTEGVKSFMANSGTYKHVHKKHKPKPVTRHSGASASKKKKKPAASKKSVPKRTSQKKKVSRPGISSITGRKLSLKNAPVKKLNAPSTGISNAKPKPQGRSKPADPLQQSPKKTNPGDVKKRNAKLISQSSQNKFTRPSGSSKKDR